MAPSANPMPTGPAPPILTPSWASSKLTALISAPPPNASTSPTSCSLQSRASERRAPMTSDEAASAPHPSAAATSVVRPIRHDAAEAYGRARSGRGFRPRRTKMDPVGESEDRDVTRRTHLAAERTWLAWWRSGIAAATAAVAVGGVVPELVDGGRTPYIVLGAGYALLAAGGFPAPAARRRQGDRAPARGGYVGGGGRGGVAVTPV